MVLCSVDTHSRGDMTHSRLSVASFPGPAQLSVTWSTEKRFFVCARGEPGNEARLSVVDSIHFSHVWESLGTRL